MKTDYNPLEEGETHINAYSKSRTELGLLLSNFAHTPFDCDDGHFESVEGLWYWLLSNDADKDQLRALYGFEAKKVGRTMSREVHWADDNETFVRKITSAVRIKIETHPGLKDMLRESGELPIVHYYMYGANCNYPTSGLWLWKEVETVRDGLRSPFLNF